MVSYKKILIKLSGEGLGEPPHLPVSPNKILELSHDIKKLLAENIKISIVVGGGNFFRGINHDKYGLTQVTSDSIGMMATILNGLAIADIFNQIGIKTIVFSALELNKFTEFYNVNKVNEYLDNNYVTILCGGIASPYFTTDTTAIIRAAELNCEAVFKATQVNGIYNKDPKIYKDAEKLEKISFDDVIKNNLKVMDTQAIVIAKTTKIPIYIFNMHNKNGIFDAITKQINCSVISN